MAFLFQTSRLKIEHRQGWLQKQQLSATLVFILLVYADSKVLNLCGSTETAQAVVIGPEGSDVSSANFIQVTFAGSHSCGRKSQTNHAHSALYGYKKNAYVHTQQCTFKDAVGDAPLWSADHALFFSNDAVALAGDWDGAPKVTEPLPESFFDFFVQPADPWFLGVQEVCL